MRGTGGTGACLRCRRRAAPPGAVHRPATALPPAALQESKSTCYSRGSTGSLSSASTPKTHSWTRLSGSR
jgi:hypothetical protein